MRTFFPTMPRLTRKRTTPVCATLAVSAALAAIGPASAQPADAGYARPVPYEQQMAALEADRVLDRPIGGIENDYWFDYLSDVGEARHELAKDLKRATDSEDHRDAWEEYRHELVDARQDYGKQMRKKAIACAKCASPATIMAINASAGIAA